MIKCIDAYPKCRSEYLEDKQRFKKLLEIPMIELNKELSKKEIFKEFISKSIFDTEVQYLAISSNTNSNDTTKVFDIFNKKDVINIITDDISIRNSIARSESQNDNQKVTLYSEELKKISEK